MSRLSLSFLEPHVAVEQCEDGLLAEIRLRRRSVDFLNLRSRELLDETVLNPRLSIQAHKSFSYAEFAPMQFLGKEELVDRQNLVGVREDRLALLQKKSHLVELRQAIDSHDVLV